MATEPAGTRERRNVEAQALVDAIAGDVQSRIMTGDIAIGSWLRQERLAVEYGISRTPVREALRKLQAAGTIEIKPHRGALVRGPTAREIREAYEVRAELEALAAALAATWIGDEALGRLREAEALLRQAGEPQRRRGRRPPDWRAANDRFHEAVQAAAGNDCLAALIGQLHRAFPRGLTWRPLSEDSHLLAANIEEHGRILGAIEARDGDEARVLMRDHVLRSGALVARWFERRGEPANGAHIDLHGVR